MLFIYFALFSVLLSLGQITAQLNRQEERDQSKYDIYDELYWDEQIAAVKSAQESQVKTKFDAFMMKHQSRIAYAFVVIIFFVAVITNLRG